MIPPRDAPLSRRSDLLPPTARRYAHPSAPEARRHPAMRARRSFVVPRRQQRSRHGTAEHGEQSSPRALTTRPPCVVIARQAAGCDPPTGHRTHRAAGEGGRVDPSISENRNVTVPPTAAATPGGAPPLPFTTTTTSPTRRYQSLLAASPQAGRSHPAGSLSQLFGCGGDGFRGVARVWADLRSWYSTDRPIGCSDLIRTATTSDPRPVAVDEIEVHGVVRRCDSADRRRPRRRPTGGRPHSPPSVAQPPAWRRSPGHVAEI